MEAWSEFVLTVREGILSLQGDIYKYVLDMMLEEFKLSVEHDEIQKIQKALEMRKLLSAHSDSISDEDLEKYTLLLQDVIDIRLLLERNKNQEMFFFQEKIIFKN